MSLPLQRRIQEVRGGAFLAGKNAGTSWDESGRSPGSHQVNECVPVVSCCCILYNLWKYRIYSSVMYFIKYSYTYVSECFTNHSHKYI